jgi:hypothetical protein
VSGLSEVLLAVIAVAVMVMAIVQVGAIVAGVRAARRLEEITQEIRTEIRPVVANLATLTAEAHRAANLATAQMERLDRLFGELVQRVERTVASAQQVLAGPAREAMAIVSGIRAAVAAIQDLRETTRRRSARAVPFEEEEESLFIG